MHAGTHTTVLTPVCFCQPLPSLTCLLLLLLHPWMAFLEASAQHPVAQSLEWGTGNIKLGGKEDVGGEVPGVSCRGGAHLARDFYFV